MVALTQQGNGLLLSTQTQRILAHAVSPPPKPGTRVHQLLYSHCIDSTFSLTADGQLAFHDCRAPPADVAHSSKATPPAAAAAASWPPTATVPSDLGTAVCMALLHVTETLTPQQEKRCQQAVRQLNEALPDFIPPENIPRATAADVLLATRLAPRSAFADAAMPSPSVSNSPTPPVPAPSVGHFLRPAAQRLWVLLGTEHGAITLFSPETGHNHTVLAQAHGDAVSHLCVAPSSEVIVSFGQDGLVHLWHVAGYEVVELLDAAAAARAHLACARQPPALHVRPLPLQAVPRLVGVRRFYLPGVPLAAALLGARLFCSLRDSATGHASLFLYDGDAEATMMHSRTDDHSSPLTALTACEALGVVATADRAGIVKLWSEDNSLLSTMDLDAPVAALCFLNNGAELLVSVQHQLHLLKVASFLPSSKKDQAVAALEGRAPPWISGEELVPIETSLLVLSEGLLPETCETVEADEESCYPAATLPLYRRLAAVALAADYMGLYGSSMPSRQPTRQGGRQTHTTATRLFSARSPGPADNSARDLRSDPTSERTAGRETVGNAQKAAPTATGTARVQSAAAARRLALEQRDADVERVLSRRAAAMRSTAAAAAPASRRAARRALRDLRSTDPQSQALRAVCERYADADGQAPGAEAELTAEEQDKLAAEAATLPEVRH